MPSRRKFVVTSGAAAVAAAAGCGGGGSPSSATPTPTPTPGPTPAAPNQVRVPLPAVGQTVAATGQLLQPLPLAITRVNDASVAAVSRVCTHEGCTVDLPSAPGRSLDCPCHGSRFLVTGQVLNGPAVRALASFPATIEGGQVVVTLPPV